MKIITTNKWRGKHTKVLCRKSQRAFKAFKKAHPQFIIKSVTRQIYGCYGTLCIKYYNMETQMDYTDPYIFF